MSHWGPQAPQDWDHKQALPLAKFTGTALALSEEGPPPPHSLCLLGKEPWTPPMTGAFQASTTQTWPQR